MNMLAIRAACPENNLDQEQDANAALTELDRALRSNRIGEQCEAIVRFPKLFEKYPFPILINASFLKLADVFRLGSNFLRLCVLRVCQQSDKHLDKISNVEEFIRRIFSVIHSNDPIARALTLRTLGAVVGVIPENQQVHHSIHSSFDSHDTIEVEAAIFAARQFASQSKTFAITMCEKISGLIEGLETPLSMKLQLIPILQYMHHDITTATLVRNLCIKLLPMYPAKQFVIVILKTLTYLAATTLVDIPNQVSLLLNYLENDPRWEVKYQTLESLRELAGHGGYLWPDNAIEVIVNFASNTKKQKALSLSLSVIQVLTDSPITCHTHHSPTSILWQLCEKSVFSLNLVISTQSLQILTKILCYCYQENLPVQTSVKVDKLLKTYILILLHKEDNDYHYLFKLCLKSVVNVCKAHKEYSPVFVDMLVYQLINSKGFINNTICETLSAIGSFHPKVLVNHQQEFIEKLKELSALDNPTPEETQTKVMICTILFQLFVEYEWNQDIIEEIYKVIEKTNNSWAKYKIARAALRYGHPIISYIVLDGLTEYVSSEHFHFWLVSLKEISSAEEQLLSEVDSKVTLVDNLNRSINHYHRAMSSLRASSTPLFSLQFQLEYIRLRTEFLQCLLQIVHTTSSLCVVPPPAIASSIAHSSRDELQRHGYITSQLRKRMNMIKSCGEMYYNLYRSVFDADPSTLENIQLLQQACALMEITLEKICVSGSNNRESPIEFGSCTDQMELQPMVRSCRNAANFGQFLIIQNEETGITHKHMACLVKQVEELTKIAICLPRYFFQTLQLTSVKLAISPQPRVTGEFISVQPGSQLAVKVEGVIQHGQKAGLFRTVTEVAITVTYQVQNTGKNNDGKSTQARDKDKEGSSVLSQTVTPHKDFFSAQFLLEFSSGGQYLVAVEAALVDEKQNTWKTGPKSTLTVKVPEETERKPNTSSPIPSISNLTQT